MPRPVDANRRVDYVAVCADCDLERPMPERSMAEYVKEVHEDRLGHEVTVRPGPATDRDER